jgi:predicted DCC family thiol-disulfide oxidoreductase YuxK
MYNAPVILFDGVCNLCNKSVQIVLKNDSKKLFLFASLQSKAGQALLQQYNLPLNNFNSFVLIQNGKAYLKSNAALQIATQLKGLYPLLYAFKIVPLFIRNAVYDFIAKNRYKWFGKSDTCMMPSPDIKKQFLD